MKSIVTACIVCLVCLSIFAVPATADGGVGIDPVSITGITLKPGETQNAQINVTLPGSVPKGDVVFVFDTTLSMIPVLNSMKEKGIQVMNAIRTVIPDTRFGAGSFMDYPKDYPGFYGYTMLPFGYGCATAGDYAWKMDQNLTDDVLAVNAAINNIPNGDGGDIPQDYTRVIYESGSYSWRADAKKIYVIFGDAPPHGAPSGSSLFKEVPGYSPWGGDPGRDEIAYTADDLDYIPVIENVSAQHISIVGVYCPYRGELQVPPTDAEINFRYMADNTGGFFLSSDPLSDSGVFADKMVAMIKGISKQNINEIGLQVEDSGYSAWMTSPDAYTDVPWPSTEIFHVAITPPVGTKDGDYTFPVDVVGDGVVLGKVTVTVHVASGQVVTPTKVSVDIKPGSCPNSFNIREKGVLPVAILGDKDLKVSSIDPKSINLTRDGGTDGVKPIRSSIADVASPSTKTCSCGLISGREDRKPDLDLKFDSQEVVKKLGIKKNDGCVKVTITGVLKSSDPKVPGKAITGSDYLRVLDSGSGTCGGDGSMDGNGSHDVKGSGDNGGSCGDKGSSGDKGSCGDKGSSDDNGQKGGENHGED